MGARPGLPDYQFMTPSLVSLRVLRICACGSMSLGCSYYKGFLIVLRKRN